MFFTKKMFPSLVLLLQGIIVFLRVIHSECRNHNDCVKNYSDVYNSLRLEGNYYNIALALYPSRKPSSVLVHVNLYSTKQSDHQTEGASPEQYTWSMSCLYAAIPATVLEILSLGAIFITRRTRNLDITIPPFCSNVHVREDERDEIVERVLSELQDLADSPKIENPTLNTAECVTKGHIPDISSVTIREKHIIIKVMLWSSFFFALLFGPLLALISLIVHTMGESDKTQGKDPKRKNLAKAVKCTIFFCVAGELVLFVLALVFAGISKALLDIYVILVLIIFGALIVLCIIAKLKWFDFGQETNKCEIAFIFIWGNLTAFHFCWLVIGIMINPLWGITLLLVICIFISAIMFASYNYFCALQLSKGCHIKGRLWLYGSMFVLSVVLLLVIVILSGQAFFGRESANEVLKTALVYIITTFVSWIVSKVKRVDTEQGKEKTKKSCKRPKAETNL